jgi:hypothetical protein
VLSWVEQHLQVGHLGGEEGGDVVSERWPESTVQYITVHKKMVIS